MTLKADFRWRTAMVLGLLALTGPALAQTHNGLADLNIVNRDTGQVVRSWYHNGRFYVAGDPGTRYGLRLSNRTGGRVLVVASVDGVNIITGETANYDQRGYVLGPWETTEVDGWRKSQTTIADFQFTSLSDSYAARTGRPGDVGVIGMAVFRERVPLPQAPSASITGTFMPGIARSAPMPAPPAAVPAPPPPSSVAALSPAQAAPASRSKSEGSPGPSVALRDEKLGTGHGASEWSLLNIVSFVRDTKEPQATSTIEYDTWDHLVAAGVIPANVRHPQPFPGESRLSYVPDPPS